jgi:menaquinone-dependent protoporphyrinogen oxidase
MKHILIVYSTTEGQTRRIAEFMAGVVREAGLSATMQPVEVAAVSEDGMAADGERADGVLIAASIHVGRHSQAMLRFVQRHAAVLADLPTAFLSVSLSAASEATLAEAEGYVDAFLTDAAWQPTVSGTAGGALLFEEYGFFKRLLLRRIVKSRGLDIDTSQNHEFTDWNEVRRFVEAFLRMGAEVASDAPV